MNGFFVTGTDTEIGKTVVAAALVHGLVERGFRAAGMKPVASGAAPTERGLRNEDALALMAASNVELDYHLVNPYVFEPPVAPHLAAAAANQKIDIDYLLACHRRLGDRAEWVVVEGVGGWLVPLNEREDVADLARRLGLPVLLVVGMRLGCINHALLTARAICDSGLRLAGWVANQSHEEMALLGDNLQAIDTRIDAPMIGCVPHCDAPRPQTIVRFLELGRILGA